MFTVGDKVRSLADGAIGTVQENDGNVLRVVFEDGTIEHFAAPAMQLADVKDAPGPSESAHPIDAYVLKHARNAGAAIQALRIIQDMATTRIENAKDSSVSDLCTALTEIETFAGEIIKYTTSE